MLFSEYLKSFAKEESPIGDLARDFINSKSRATTYIGILKNLKKNNACLAAYDSLECVHAYYVKQFNN